MRVFGSLGAWMRGCGKWSAIWLVCEPSIGTTLPITVARLPIPGDSMLRIHSAVIRLYQPLIPSCDRVAAVNNPLTA